MTDDELLEMAVMLAGEEYEDSLSVVYIPAAKSAVVAHLFPFDQTKGWESVPERFAVQTARIAVYLLDREGAEGETEHSENGTTRKWESADVPESMFAGMIPFAGVPA